MNEDTVKAIFIKYLQNLGKTPIIKKKNIPGPDVIIEGNAYECKGSKFNKNTLFKQLVSNALQYSRVGVVVPWDALDCLFLHKLEALEVLIRKNPNSEKSIEVYVIAQEDNTYFLRCWSSARSLSIEVDRVAYKYIDKYVKLSPKEKELETLEFLELFDEKIKEHIRNIVIEKDRTPPDRWEAFSYTLEEV